MPSERSGRAMTMNNNVKAKAKAFLNEYRLSEVTLGDLRRIITSQGYTIVEFNHIFNEGPVSRLIEMLGLDEMVETCKGFTYADRQRRLVFLHEDLSENEKLLVLAHEEGHIYCGHLSSVPIIGRDVVEEHEANEFTHYILTRSTGSRLRCFVKEHKRAVSLTAAVLAAVVIGLIAFNAVQRSAAIPYGTYYITSTGNRYHEESCIFVKNKTNVHRMTIEEFQSGKYTPCGICLPHSNPNTESGK